MKNQIYTIESFNHFKFLDGLRGTAVLIVMAYHLKRIDSQLFNFMNGGFLGVDIFFVLSGFLITSTLLKEHHKYKQINLKNFYLRRFLRLIPGYWFFLIILYLFARQILPDYEASQIYENHNFLFAFLYMTNWFRVLGFFTGNLNHTWSLSIEEQFYIIWSIFLFLVFNHKLERNSLFYIIIGSIGLIIVWRGCRIILGTSTEILYYSTDTRIDSLLIGSAAAIIYVWKLIPKESFKTFRFSSITILGVILSLLIFFNFSHTDLLFYLFPLPLFSISVALFILWLIARENTLIHSLLENKTLCWVGKISYGLYLWHYAMYEFSIKSFPTSNLLQIVVGLMLAFLVATFSFYLIEKPFLTIKSKFQS